MSGIDNRIVTMQFNNREFEQNAKTSLSTLQKLKESLNFSSVSNGAMKGLGAIGGALGKLGASKNPFATSIQGANDLQRAAQTAGGHAGMGVLEGGVTAVSGKFLALSTIAITTLSNITNRAVNAGTSFLKSFSVAPIMDGLHEYETTLKSIQTVQANTDQPLPVIEKALKDLNDYSDTTIYNFGEMAKNVGTFTAAGVNLKDSVASIRGIANVAALSGSSSEQAAGAMYQLSQAIAAGKVGAQDWNSVVNAGMAGKKLQNALAQTAVAMGVLDKSAVTTNKSSGALMVNMESFKNSIMSKPGSESWLTSGVLVNTLATLDGRFSKAYQLSLLNEDGTKRFTAAQVDANMALARANLEKKNGVKFSDQQYKDLLKMAEASTKAAQDVKTLGQVFDIAKETIGSGWSASFKSIFGNLEESKKLFTGMSQTLNKLIGDNALARNELLAAWKKGGGRDFLIDGLKDAWKGFYSILQAVSQGFRDIFPKKTSADLISMSAAFADFMHKLLPGEKTLANIRDIAGGVFAIFGIGRQILGGVVTMFKTLFESMGGGNGDFLGLLANIGNAVKRFNEFLATSGLVTAFFEGLGKILSVPMSILRGIGDIIAGIFGGFDSSAAAKVGDAVDGISQRLSGLEIVGERIKSFFTGLGDFFGNIGTHIGNALMAIGDVVADAFTADTFGSTLDVINTTLLGGLVLMLKNFFSTGISLDFSGGLFDGIKETLGAATGALENMQNSLKASILMKLAAAIAVMALALLVLSSIDPAALSKALAAMTGGFGILIGAMAVLMKVMGPAGLVQLYVITSAMTKMALSILLMSFALKTLAGIKFGDMVRGLTGLAVAMVILTKAMQPLAAGSKGMAKASFSLILVGVALNVLALALKIMATMSWEEMAKGLLTMTGALLGIGAAMRLMPKGIVLQASGILILSVALNALGVALKVFATMSWEEMGRGMAVLAASLAIIGVTMRLMPKTMLITAAGLAVVAGALVVLSGALKVMGSMGWEEIAKGMTVLAGSMLILAVGLQAIGVVGTIGAVGLLAAAGAIAIFAPLMLAFGAMKWSSILKSLAVLAGLFTILGVAGYLLAPVTPVILGLGLALLLLGAGLALAGAGALLAATAFGIVVAAGSAGIQILVGLLASLIAAIPPAMAAFGQGMVQFAVAIGQGAPAIATAFWQILINIVNQVIKIVPKLGQAFMVMLSTALRVIVTMGPRIADAGLRLIIGFLAAISRHIPRIVGLVADIIYRFLSALGQNMGKIIQGGVNLILGFLDGLTKAIRNNSKELGEKGADLGIAIIEGMARGIAGGAGRIKDQLVNIAKDALGAAKDFLGIGSPSKLFRDEVGRRVSEGMALGVGDGAPLVVGEINSMGRSAVDTASAAMRGISDAFSLDPNFNPTVTPVLDLTALTKEANKMSSILATAPIMPTVSYAQAADISTSTQESEEEGTGSRKSGGGDTYVTLEQHNHSPTALDSVAVYRGGKTLISLAKEELS